jgi:3-oxoacyl-[acyl-carrier protein] reductase
MNQPLSGKTAFVIGGSRGIGAAIVERLADDGADVAFTFVRQADAAAEVVKRIEGRGRRGLAIKADSSDATAVTDAVAQVVSSLGGLDILVVNAGHFPIGPFDEFDLGDFDHTIAVNVRAAFFASQAAARQMGDSGRIVYIGSNVAERTVFTGFALYSLSKTALIGLTKGLARDLGPRGITVNLVHPGPTVTDLNPADGPDAESIKAFTALGRFADPSEIAGTVAHLAGDDGRYITGSAIHVDGGFAA